MVNTRSSVEAIQGQVDSAVVNNASDENNASVEKKLEMLLKPLEETINTLGQLLEENNIGNYKFTDQNHST